MRLLMRCCQALQLPFLCCLPAAGCYLGQLAGRRPDRIPNKSPRVFICQLPLPTTSTCPILLLPTPYPSFVASNAAAVLDMVYYLTSQAPTVCMPTTALCAVPRPWRPLIYASTHRQHPALLPLHPVQFPPSLPTFSLQPICHQFPEPFARSPVPSSPSQIPLRTRVLAVTCLAIGTENRGSGRQRRP